MNLKQFFKDILPKTLYGRSLLIVLSPAILLQIILTIYFYEKHWDEVAKRLSRFYISNINWIVEEKAYLNDDISWNRFQEKIFKHYEMAISFTPNINLTNYPQTAGKSYLEQMLKKRMREYIQYPFHIDGQKIEDDLIVKVAVPEGVITIISQKKRLLTSTTYVFMVWMIGASILLFTVAMQFMRNQIKPIKRLARAVDQFGKGKSIPIFRLEGASELRQAASAFNGMRERIMKQMHERTEMLAAISHDLRTPLTRMSLSLAMLEENEETISLKSDIKDMELMIEEYLDFAQGEGAEQPKTTNLTSLLEDIVHQYTKHGKPITINATPNLIRALRPQAIKRAIQNLINNALQYGTCVNITATIDETNQNILIFIDDDGPGIPLTLHETVFRPFYRIDRSQQTLSAGVGLGLSIAKDIISAHGGDIELATAPQNGLRVVISLPV